MDWSSGFVKTNGIRIHYYRTGGHKPPIVLAHGITDDGLCWTRLAQALESEYDVIMPDARGHGSSDAPETGYSPNDHAADLAGLIDSLKLDNPILVGHSMGASAVSVAVGIYPGMVACIVLEDPPWPIDNAESEQERQATLQRWRHDILENKKKTIEELLSSCRKECPAWTDADYGPWSDSKRSVSPNVVCFGAVRRNWEEDRSKR